MAEYHVGCGITAIFAGILNKKKDKWINMMIKTYGKDECGNKTDLCYTSISQAAKAWNKRISPTG